MYAIRSKTISNDRSQLHVLLMAILDNLMIDFDVDCCDHIRVAELPHVQGMAVRHTRKRSDVLSDLIDVNSLRNGLQEDSRRRRAQWNS